MEVQTSQSLRRAGKRALGAALVDARRATIGLLAGLAPAQYRIPYRPTWNPPLWELGHVGWFQEYWCERWRGADREAAASLLAQADGWFDSRVVAHPTRWTQPLPTLAATHDYLARVLDAALASLERQEDDDRSLYFHRLVLYHELMHQEAFAYTLQNLGYAMPPGADWLPRAAPPANGPIDLPAAEHRLGAAPRSGFVFDNEKWAHPVALAPCRIDAQPVTCGQFRAFVEDGGYRDPRWWDPQALERLRAEGREAPAIWRRAGPDWRIHWFGRELPLPEQSAVVQVSAFEAQAYCRWAGRSLPTEAQWERAALSRADFRWGDEAWEWTASDFLPFTGFAADPYAEYSAPWFGTHRVVRGGSFATPPALRDPKFRNFYEPWRNDLFIGFRTCG